MAFPLILIAAAAVAQPAQNSRRFGEGRTFMSPMGEPFIGRAPGEDGLVVWFQQADRNHDGVLTADEMVADADRFFQTLDINQDGEIDPDEIAHYENVIAPEVRTGRIPVADASTGNDQQDGQRGGGYGGRGGGGGRHRGGRGGGFGGGFGGDDEARAGLYGLLEIPEPVASADADLNRGVSAKEFRNAAVQRFQLLDINHTGRLTLGELQGIREAAESDARRPPQRKSDDDSGEEQPQE